MLNLKEFQFPKITGLDLVFPTMDADPALLAEARDRGFYSGNGEYNQLFSRRVS